jgi:imidazolonepropionase
VKQIFLRSLLNLASDMQKDTTVWRNARIATCDATMTVFDPGAIVSREGLIIWVGAEQDLPQEFKQPAVINEDLQQRWLTPALIDCHTHLIYAGNRADEFAARLQGASYAQIAQRGGGINSTVRATRAASEQQLFDLSVPRLQSLLAEGVGCIEIKSGYGLNFETEAKMLRVARRLAASFPVTIKTTFLGAHAVPPEYQNQTDQYLQQVAFDWLPRLHDAGLVDAVDIFCESIAFNLQHADLLFEQAQKRNIPIKMHAEQLTNLGGSKLAARYRALSCDHLEYTTAEDVVALAGAGTVAVLLPVAFYCLAEKQLPPIAALRSHGVPMAVASDSNPGSAPGASLLLALNMGCRFFGLHAAEVLAGATRHAARALGEQEQRGSLSVGRCADFAVWNIQSLDEIGYWSGFNPCHGLIRAGRWVSRSNSHANTH